MADCSVCYFYWKTSGNCNATQKATVVKKFFMNSHNFTWGFGCRESWRFQAKAYLVENGDEMNLKISNVDRGRVIWMGWEIGMDSGGGWGGGLEDMDGDKRYGWGDGYR